jgi:hypothetical protein
MKVEQAFTALADGIKKHGAPVCQEIDGELWFPEAGGESYELRQAKKICSECPVQLLCAKYALAADEAYGIWGGLTPSQRDDIRKGRITLEKALARSADRVKNFRLKEKR